MSLHVHTYISHSKGWGDNGYTGFYFSDDGHIHGPNGYTGFYRDGAHIHGPNGYTQCYFDGQHIYGPKEALPWAGK